VAQAHGEPVELHGAACEFPRPPAQPSRGRRSMSQPIPRPAARPALSAPHRSEQLRQNQRGRNRACRRNRNPSAAHGLRVPAKSLAQRRFHHGRRLLAARSLRPGGESRCQALLFGQAFAAAGTSLHVRQRLLLSLSRAPGPEMIASTSWQFMRRPSFSPSISQAAWPAPDAAGPHRSDRAPQRRRRFAVTHLVQVAQHHHFPKARRQRQDRAPDSLDRLIARQTPSVSPASVQRAASRSSSLR